MSYLMNMRIGARLALGFGALVLLLIGMSGVGISRIRAVDHNLEVIVHDRVAKLVLAHDITNEVNRQSRALRTALIASDPAVVRSELAKVEDSAPLVAKALDALIQTVTSERGTAALTKLVDARRVFKAEENQLIEMIKNGRIAEGREFLVREMLPPQAAYLAAIDNFSKTQNESMEVFAAEAEAMTEGAVTLMLVLAGVALVVAIVIGRLVTRSVIDPIQDALNLAQRVAAGNLSTRIESHGKCEAAQLLVALNQMADTLTVIMGGVRVNADNVASASVQIAQGNNDLSGRTEQQTAALQQTAAFMAKLSVTVQQNSDNARQADQLAKVASSVAVQGGDVVGNVVKTMKDINESSRRRLCENAAAAWLVVNRSAARPV